MTTFHWTSALGEFLDVVLPDLAALVRGCPDDVWELSMWDVAKDQGWGRPEPPVLPDGDPDPRGVDAHAAVWYATLHLVYTLDWNFSARAPRGSRRRRFARTTSTPAGCRSGRTRGKSCCPTSR